MAEFTCPRCGNLFRDVPCRSCKGVVKGYICSECGERIPNQGWSGEHHIWVRSNMTGEWTKEGAMVQEVV